MKNGVFVGYTTELYQTSRMDPRNEHNMTVYQYYAGLKLGLGPVRPFILTVTSIVKHFGWMLFQK